MHVFLPDSLSELGHHTALSSALPLLGASPDAMIHHRVPITRSDLLEGRMLLGRLMGQDTTEEKDDGHLSSSLLDSFGVLPGEPLSKEMALQRVSKAIALRALSYEVSKVPTSVSVGSDNDVSSDPTPPPLPLVKSTWSDCIAAISDRLSVEPDSYPSNYDKSDLAEGDDVALWVDIREAVEVKNHSPFVFKDQRKARKIRLHLEYRIADQGPMSGVRPAWVPQMQMHCLAAGVPSVLLLSRSATKGVKLFRMER